MLDIENIYINTFKKCKKPASDDFFQGVIISSYMQNANVNTVCVVRLIDGLKEQHLYKPTLSVRVYFGETPAYPRKRALEITKLAIDAAYKCIEHENIFSVDVTNIERDFDATYDREYYEVLLDFIICE